MKHPLRLRLRGLSATEGIAAVEFAIIGSVFLMILLGVVEFGYDWFLKHAITNASRDGCRYGVMYRTDPANPNNQIAPSSLTSPNRIEDVVSNYLRQVLPSDSTWTVTCSGAGYTSAKGEDPANPGVKLPLTVTVSTTKTWSALGSMIPQLQDMTVTAQTVMLRE
ncbi:MAG TPA: TadE/TadG family type IV pilus assembly protein [Desulfobaccales bacterium]